MGFVIKKYSCLLPPRKYLLSDKAFGWCLSPRVDAKGLVPLLGCLSVRFPANPSFSHSQGLKGSLNVPYMEQVGGRFPHFQQFVRKRLGNLFSFVVVVSGSRILVGCHGKKAMILAISQASVGSL